MTDYRFESFTPDEKAAYRAGERAAASSRLDAKINPYARHAQANLWRKWDEGFRRHVAFLDSIDR